MRRYAQIPSDVKYFMVLADNPQVYDQSGTLFPVMDTSSLELLLIVRSPQPTIPAGSQLKDLGRTVTRYNPTTRLHDAIYRQVMLVNGFSTEGVTNDPIDIFYIKTWSADFDFQVARVARTGPGVA